MKIKSPTKKSMKYNEVVQDHISPPFKLFHKPSSLITNSNNEYRIIMYTKCDVSLSVKIIPNLIFIFIILQPQVYSLISHWIHLTTMMARDTIEFAPLSSIISHTLLNSKLQIHPKSVMYLSTCFCV